MANVSDKEFTAEDQALGHFITGYVKLDQHELGPPVSDEEIALLLEGSAEKKLGSARVEQIQAQIYKDPELYQDWLSMVQGYEEEFPHKSLTRTVATADQQTLGLGRWLGIIQDFLTPQVGFASAFSVVATFVFAWYVLPAGPNPGDPSLAVHEAVPTPQKAAIDYSASSHAEAVVATALVETFHCEAVSQVDGGEVCYSKTPQVQHWFFVQKPNTLQALSALVNADKVLSVKSSADLLLIEFARQNSFHLALFSTAMVDGEFTLDQIYEDDAKDGYFDQMELSDGTLRYQLNTESGTETKQFHHEL